MHLKAYKYVLVTLLLFGMGFLVGSSLDIVYRRYVREQAFILHAETIDPHRVEKEASTKGIPREIAGMLRTELLTGDRAKEFVCGYLGKDRDLEEAYISTYRGTSGDAVIFIADFANISESEEVLNLMKKTLEEDTSFEEFSTLSIFDDVVINRLQDSKNVHYFFNKGARVLWLMVNCADNLDVLMDVYMRF